MSRVSGMASLPPSDHRGPLRPPHCEGGGGDMQPKLVWCWASVVDGGSALNQHWVNVSCLPGGGGGQFPKDTIHKSYVGLMLSQCPRRWRPNMRKTSWMINLIIDFFRGRGVGTLEDFTKKNPIFIVIEKNLASCCFEKKWAWVAQLLPAQYDRPIKYRE